MGCETQKEQYDRYRAVLNEEYPPKGTRKPTPQEAASLAKLRAAFLACLGSEKPIQTIFSPAGQWNYGGKPGPIIKANGNSLTVDMSAFGRAQADGIIVDATTILVFFPDENYGADHTGKLQLAGNTGEIIWDNQSAWTLTQFTLFQSNFDGTPAGQAPFAAQAVGSAQFNGPNVVFSPTFPNSGNWLKIGPLGTAGAQFSADFLPHASAYGIYTISASMFMSSTPTSADVYLAVNRAGGGNPPLTLFFRNNSVLENLQPTGCTFARNQAFGVQITLTVTATSSTAQLRVAGSAATFTLNQSLANLGSLSLGIDSGYANVFEVGSLLVTFTPQ